MSTSDVRFRLATPQDCAQLVPLINTAFSIETFLESTRTDDQRLGAMMEKGAIIVAEDTDGRIIGSVYSEVRGRRGYLGMLAVDPSRQRLGLSRRIVAAAEDHLRLSGCEAVDITVLSLRPELPPIYRRFGYVETGTEPFIPSQPLKPGLECHCIVMSKRLGSGA